MNGAKAESSGLGKGLGVTALTFNLLVRLTFKKIYKVDIKKRVREEKYMTER